MQSPYPQKAGIPFLINQAFSYWFKTLLFQILFSLIYFSIFLTVGYYFAAQYGILDSYLSLSEKLTQSLEVYQAGVREMMELPGFMTFYWIMIACAVFLFPLNFGLYYAYRKIDLGQKIVISDLFVGYQGIRFFAYISFYLFWLLIYQYAVATIFLGVVWVLITLFSAPLMFFVQKRFMETIPINFKALQRFPIEIIVCSFFALLFKYSGVITIIGAIVTYPFWTAMIYVLYRKIFNEIKEN